MNGTQRGATLVELIVSIVVISVGLAGVLIAINRNVSSSADPMIQHQTVAIAEAYLEEILTKNFAHTADPGENRSTFNDVDDYGLLVPFQNGCIAALATAACPVGACVCDQRGAPIAALQGYNVTVSVVPEAIGPAGNTANAKRVQVTVAPPVGGSSIVVSGYRTDY